MTWQIAMMQNTHKKMQFNRGVRPLDTKKKSVESQSSLLNAYVIHLNRAGFPNVSKKKNRAGFEENPIKHVLQNRTDLFILEANSNR